MKRETRPDKQYWPSTASTGLGGVRSNLQIERDVLLTFFNTTAITLIVILKLRDTFKRDNIR